MAYKKEVGGGFVYCPIVVQQYCNSVVNAVSGRNIWMLDSCTKASK